MQRRIRALACAAVLGCAFSLPAQALAPERRTTLTDQRDLSLTVYNQQLALVHDRRRVPLTAGRQRLAWRDVSAQIDPTSAILEDAGATAAPQIIEQNFEYDVLSPATMLAKFVGRDVTVVHPSPAPGKAMSETARVVSVEDGVTLQYRDRVETEVDGRIVFPALPPDLRDQPTLVLDLDGAAAGTHDLDLSYLTGGLQWYADYIAVVSPQRDRLSLHGLVTLTNESGIPYSNARLQLVAGDVNNVRPPSLKEIRTIGAARARAADGAIAVRQEDFFEYHLYTLGLRTSIGQRQTKQVAFLDARSVPIRQTYELRDRFSQIDFRDSRGRSLQEARLRVGAFVTFTNRGGDLGVPLPGGRLRFYERTSLNRLHYLGADDIVHTPANEDVRLSVGYAADVVAHRKQTDQRGSVGAGFENAYEVTIANGKPKPIDVLVIEAMPDDWTIVSESTPHTKTSSSTAAWTIHIAAESRSTLTYRVHSPQRKIGEQVF